MTDSPLLTAQEAAAILGVCRSFLTAHAAQIGGIKVGSRLKFRRADLDAYMDRQRVTDPAPVEQPTPIRTVATTPVGTGPINPITGKAWDYLKAGGRR